MKRLSPVHALVVLCVLLLPAGALSQSEPQLAEATGMFAGPDFVPDDPGIPARMLELMQSSQLRYQEGSNLLKLGASTKARAAFNEAVHMVLQSGWDLNATPVLNRFFQDLIRRIQQDESRYLRPAEVAEEAPEEAVVDELEKLDLIPITIDSSLKDVVEQDLANTRYDIPIVLNDRVLKSLNYWLNKGRKFFSDGLLRSGRYRDMIQKTFREEGIPLDVMYLAQVESLFKTNALSRKQAKGIWQFGKWTAIRYGLKVNNHIDERSDPEKSTRAAARYLNELYTMFKDWNLVLAAYNWGEGKVQRLIDRSGLNDFWEIMDLRRNFPAETQNHVPLIMASIILARNPEKYGLPTELEAPLSYDRVVVTKPIDLRAAARSLEISPDQLKQLNPALRGNTTPAGYPDFELRIPRGTPSDLTQKLASLPAVKPAALVASARSTGTRLAGGRYRVRPGDTLHEIARRHHVSLSALQRANDVGAARSLRVGTWIQIPSSRSLASKSPTSRMKSAASSKTASPANKLQRAASR